MKLSEYSRPAEDAEDILRQHHRGHRILVVDDVPLNRKVARIHLEAVGLVVDEATDGANAVVMAQKANYAAIFMDVQMPNLNGLDATRQIREIPGHRETPIIALTSNDHAEDKARCFEAGMNDFLTKPYDLNLFFATLLLSLSQRDV
jgi:CheY-like chemotaxis protein